MFDIFEENLETIESLNKKRKPRKALPRITVDMSERMYTRSLSLIVKDESQNKKVSVDGVCKYGRGIGRKIIMQRRLQEKQLIMQ